MDLLVIRLRSNQLNFLFEAAKPQDKNYFLYHCKGGGMFGYPYPCTAASLVHYSYSTGYLVFQSSFFFGL